MKLAEIAEAAGGTRQSKTQSRLPSIQGGHIKDIQGKDFGDLIAVHPTEYRDGKGSVIWACLCNCKTVAYVTENSLVWGNTKSCGCLKEKFQSEINGRLHFVDGTCVEWIEKRKHRSDNVSGFRGVYKLRDDRYRVSIGFKGKRHHLGYFRTFEEAKQARLGAEEQLYKPFLKEFYGASEDYMYHVKLGSGKDSG